MPVASIEPDPALCIPRDSQPRQPAFDRGLRERARPARRRGEVGDVEPHQLGRGGRESAPFNWPQRTKAAQSRV